jgi:hypothetical protein
MPIRSAVIALPREIVACPTVHARDAGVTPGRGVAAGVTPCRGRRPPPRRGDLRGPRPAVGRRGRRAATVTGRRRGRRVPTATGRRRAFRVVRCARGLPTLCPRGLPTLCARVHRPGGAAAIRPTHYGSGVHGPAPRPRCTRPAMAGGHLPSPPRPRGLTDVARTTRPEPSTAAGGGRRFRALANPAARRPRVDTMFLTTAVVGRGPPVPPRRPDAMPGALRREKNPQGHLRTRELR